MESSAPLGERALIADGLSFPSSLTLGSADEVFVGESGVPFDGAPPGGRVWQVMAGGKRRLVGNGFAPPLNGLTFHDGALYVSTGDQPGRILRLDLDGRQTVVLDGLPGPGNYHVNEVAFAPGGRMFFSQGAMTNSGVVGLDSYEMGWLQRLPHGHDRPGRNITLAGVNFETANPLVERAGARTRTGAFAPFGTTTEPGELVAGSLPATAAVMSCNPDGSDLRLVAWGLRNAWGLGFLPDGRLLATDQGADDRGSRPVGNAPDLLFEVREGDRWYGWPDFIGGEPITAERFRSARGGPRSEFLLAEHDRLPVPEAPLLRFPPHVAAVKFASVPLGAPRWRGQIVVALFGDEAPMTAPAGGPKLGRSVARIDTESWTLHDDAVAGPFERPIDVRFTADGRFLYVLDFGHFEMGDGGVLARRESGALWRFDLAGHKGGEPAGS